MRTEAEHYRRRCEVARRKADAIPNWYGGGRWFWVETMSPLAMMQYGRRATILIESEYQASRLRGKT